MSKSYSSGLNFTWPTLGDTSWAATVDTALAAISAHTHDGAGNGAGLAANSVNGARILLANNEALRALNASAVATNLLKLNASNILEVLQSSNITNGYFALSSSETLTASGAISVTTSITILNGATIAMTLADGVPGQLKLIVNINSTPASVVPATTAGANSVSLGQNGAVLYLFLSGEWRAVCSTATTQVTDDVQSFAAAGTWNGYTKLVVATGTTYTITMPGTANDGQTVMVRNQASGNVTFGGQVMATGTYYLYSYLNAGWRRVALT